MIFIIVDLFEGGEATRWVSRSYAWTDVHVHDRGIEIGEHALETCDARIGISITLDSDSIWLGQLCRRRGKRDHDGVDGGSCTQKCLGQQSRL